MRPTLHIITGPPGSGKSTMARGLGHPVYDNDLGNRTAFQTVSPKVEASLTVTAPSAKDKSYWSGVALSHGYSPKLYCLWLSKMQTFVRMKARSGTDTVGKDGSIIPAKSQSNTADKWVHRWYKNYTRHPQEERINAGS